MTDFIPTKTINLEEDQSVEVVDLPEAIRTQIELYDAWRLNDYDTRNEFTEIQEKTKAELVKVQYALRVLGAEIATAVKEHLNPTETTDGEEMPAEQE